MVEVENKTKNQENKTKQASKQKLIIEGHSMHKMNFFQISFHKCEFLHYSELVYSKNYLNPVEIFVSSLFKMVAYQTVLHV